jgi:hypothetical protein
MKHLLLALTVFVLININCNASDNKRGAVKLATNSFALEYCNCLYVMEMGVKYCKGYIFNQAPLPHFLFGVEESINKENKISVSSRLTLNFITSTAAYDKTAGGCSIVNY